MIDSEINKEIESIISWWYNLKKGYTDINHLDEVHRKLSGLYFYLSEIVASNYKEYIFSYIDKKIGLAKRNAALIEQGESATKAREIAAMYEKDILIDEMQKESEYNATKLKLNAIAKILEAIRQRISNLKTEINKQ